MNEILLHAQIDEDGLVTIHDQEGRKLAGMINLTLSAGADEVTTANINVCLHDSHGKKYVNRVRRK